MTDDDDKFRQEINGLPRSRRGGSQGRHRLPAAEGARGRRSRGWRSPKRVRRAGIALRHAFAGAGDGRRRPRPSDRRPALASASLLHRRRRASATSNGSSTSKRGTSRNWTPQILSSDLPIDAYLDRGFQTWLTRTERRLIRAALSHQRLALALPSSRIRSPMPRSRWARRRGRSCPRRNSRCWRRSRPTGTSSTRSASRNGAASRSAIRR